MDIPDYCHSLAQHLTSPAIERRHQDSSNSLEVRLSQSGNLSMLCRMPSIDRRLIAMELLPRYFSREGFFYNKAGKYYEFILDSDGLPEAAWVYFINYLNKPSILEKIVYIKGNFTLVVFYRGPINYSTSGVIEWINPNRVSCIDIDKGGVNKLEVHEAFKSYVESRELERIKQELKKKGGTLVFNNKIQLPKLSPSRRMFRPQKILG